MNNGALITIHETILAQRQPLIRYDRIRWIENEKYFDSLHLMESVLLLHPLLFKPNFMFLKWDFSLIICIIYVLSSNVRVVDLVRFIMFAIWLMTHPQQQKQKENDEPLWCWTNAIAIIQWWWKLNEENVTMHTQEWL